MRSSRRAEWLRTALQIEMHLTLAFERAFRLGERPVSAEVVEQVLSRAIDELEPTLTRNGYDALALTVLLKAKPAEVRDFLAGTLPSDRLPDTLWVKVYQPRRPVPARNGTFPGVLTNTGGANRRQMIHFPVNPAHFAGKAPMAEPFQLPLFPDQASLTRIRPARNESRFYRLAVWPDLFGHALLARQWGRIGTAARLRLDPHPDPGAAINALARLARAKRRRGYRDSPA